MVFFFFKGEKNRGADLFRHPIYVDHVDAVRDKCMTFSRCCPETVGSVVNKSGRLLSWRLLPFFLCRWEIEHESNRATYESKPNVEGEKSERGLRWPNLYTHWRHTEASNHPWLFSWRNVTHLGSECTNSHRLSLSFSDSIKGLRFFFFSFLVNGINRVAPLFSLLCRSSTSANRMKTSLSLVLLFLFFTSFFRI